MFELNEPEKDSLCRMKATSVEMNALINDRITA